jgi:hypothetical protein
MLKIVFRKINLVILGRLDFNLDGFYVSENSYKALEGFGMSSVRNHQSHVILDLVLKPT